LSVTAKAVGFHLDLDPVGVAGQRLVHGVVDDFGEQVMQRLLVGAADIHAGAAAHRLKPFQHLDVLGGIAGLVTTARRWRATARAAAGAPFGSGIGEQIRRFRGFRCFSHALPHVGPFRHRATDRTNQHSTMPRKDEPSVD
jgi:hypothetical protein